MSGWHFEPWDESHGYHRTPLQGFLNARIQVDLLFSLRPCAACPPCKVGEVPEGRGGLFKKSAVGGSRG